MSDPTRLPEPWYFRPEGRKWLEPKAHKLRNLTLILGYYAGMGTLIAAPLAGVVYLASPETVRAFTGHYSAWPVGALVGFALAALASVWYRRTFPQNPGALKVLLPLVTGLGSLCGAAFAFGGGFVGEATLFLTLFGALAYIYMEALPPKESEGAPTDPPSDAT